VSEPFLAEIRIFGFNFAPRGWAMCDGQLMPIYLNQSLYSLLGTTYGGDGRTTFALPELRGRTPIHVGAGHTHGQKSGEESHTLSTAEMPSHSHQAQATSSPANQGDPAAHVLANTAPTGISVYGSGPAGDMGAGTVATAGGGAAHENMQPFLALNFCIALQGTFPSRN
jgi:microcystin-dependent protein